MRPAFSDFAGRARDLFDGQERRRTDSHPIHKPGSHTPRGYLVNRLPRAPRSERRRLRGRCAPSTRSTTPTVCRCARVGIDEVQPSTPIVVMLRCNQLRSGYCRGGRFPQRLSRISGRHPHIHADNRRCLASLIHYSVVCSRRRCRHAGSGVNQHQRALRQTNDWDKKTASRRWRSRGL